MIYVFILLVSPWYMYKGSCFRDICADTVVVGGYLKGSTGVCVYIYISIHIHSISLFRVKWKGYFQWIMYFLERASLTGHFGSSGWWSCRFFSIINPGEIRVMLTNLAILNWAPPPRTEGPKIHGSLGLVSLVLEYLSHQKIAETSCCLVHPEIGCLAP